MNTHLSMFHMGISCLCESSWDVCVHVHVSVGLRMHVYVHVLTCSYGQQMAH